MDIYLDLCKCYMSGKLGPRNLFKKSGGVALLLWVGIIPIYNAIDSEWIFIEIGRVLLIPEKTNFVESCLITLSSPYLSTLKYAIDISSPSKRKERMMKPVKKNGWLI